MLGDSTCSSPSPTLKKLPKCPGFFSNFSGSSNFTSHATSPLGYQSAHSKWLSRKPKDSYIDVLTLFERTDCKASARPSADEMTSPLKHKLQRANNVEHPSSKYSKRETSTALPQKVIVEQKETLCTTLLRRLRQTWPRNPIMTLHIMYAVIASLVA